jgi:hypothetical protein
MKNSIKFILAAGFLFALLSSCSNDDIKLPEGLKPSSSSVGQENNINCLIVGKGCNYISRVLCDDIGGITLEEGELECATTGDYLKPIPSFTCGWVPDTVATGDSAKILFKLSSTDPNCTEKAVKVIGRDTSEFEGFGEEMEIKNSYFSWKVLGYLSCEETITTETETTTLKGKSKYVLCDSLNAKPLPLPPPPDSPLVAGYFAINSILSPCEECYYSIGVTPVITDSVLTITNKVAAECGDVKYELKVNGSTTKKAVVLGDIVEAVATAFCNDEEKTLKRITATVVPNPTLSPCVLDSLLLDVATRDTTRVMHEDQILKVKGVVLSNDYGRCGDIQYIFNSGSSSSSRAVGSSSSRAVGLSSSRAGSSSSISGASVSEISLKNYVGQSITARASVTCPGFTQPLTANCPAVYVAHHKSIPSSEGGCERDKNKFDFKSGVTVLEFACEEEKSLNDVGDSYYINCNCEGERCDDSFDVIADGGTNKGEGHNGWNFFPGLPAIKDGALYRYPVPALVKTKGDLKCGIW